MIVNQGDVYCPHCLSEWVEFRYEISNGSTFHCDRCGEIRVPHIIDADGRFWWDWDDQHPQPNPGCPWCGTCNVSPGILDLWAGRHAYWSCNRIACRAEWWGFWSYYPKTGVKRWTLRVPTRDVPFRVID